MLKTAGKLDRVVFIQDNEPYLLINEYYLFYLERCEIFSKSQHIFDEEKTVQKQLADIELYEDGKLINNRQFVKSHENIYVQISDMFAGLLRKLFMFLDENSIENVHDVAIGLNDAQINNFKTIWSLISRSDKKSHLFIKNANTPKNINDRMIKLQILGVANNTIREGSAPNEL